jgi:hypothetical protein
MKTKRIISVLAFVAIALFTQAQHYYQSNSLPEIRIRDNWSGYNNSYQLPTTSYSVPSVRYQNTYQRYDGTVVEAHFKTQSNNTNWDNFSTRGNVNPYTGQSGTRARDYSSDALNYGKGQVIQTGSRGGQYYINSNGNKTYVPKR